MDNYEIIKILGSGGFGTVSQVKDKNDKKIYAIKQIKINNENKIKMEKEIEILSKFKSKYIVQFIKSFYDKENFYIVMEYGGNKNLSNFLNEFKENNKLLDKNILCEIISNICLGLKEIHDKNIIHRDFNPNNIFIDDKYNIKIGDFDVSKILVNKGFTTTDTGTFKYKAPELLLGKPYNNKIDIWSLGCIIYELFTLKICFDGNYVMEIYHNIIKNPHDKVNDQDWDDLINLLLKKNYEERPDINTVCNKVNQIKEKYKRMSTNCHSSLTSSKIYINFYPEEEKNIGLFFDNDISVKEMLSQFILNNNSIKTYECDKVMFLFNSYILNNEHNLGKSLKNICLRDNSIIEIISI